MGGPWRKGRTTLVCACDSRRSDRRRYYDGCPGDRGDGNGVEPCLDDGRRKFPRLMTQRGGSGRDANTCREALMLVARP
jgi:hypothetical protein